MSRRNRKIKNGNNSPQQPQPLVVTPPPCPSPGILGDGGLTREADAQLVYRAATNGWLSKIPENMLYECLAFIRQDMYSTNPRVRGIATKSFIAITGQEQKERLVAKHEPTADDKKAAFTTKDWLESMRRTIPDGT